MLCSLRCFSQTPETHTISKYTQTDGLSSYNIRNILQDPNGFTWIATQEGLNLFDGKSFTKYTNNSIAGKKISGSDVRSLAIDTVKGLLWVLNSYGSLNAINYNTGKVVRAIKGTAVNNDEWSTAMVAYNQRLWISCVNGIKSYNTLANKWEATIPIPFTENANHDLFSAEHIFADGKGNIWVFVNHYGIIVINHASRAIVKKIPVNELVEPAFAGALIFTSSVNFSANSLLIGTSYGLKLISYAEGNITINKNLPQRLRSFKDSKVQSIAISEKDLYIATSENLYKLGSDLSSFAVIKEANTKPVEKWLNEIHSLFIDGTDMLWIGCNQGLALLNNRKSPFESFNNKGYVRFDLNHVYNVMPAPAGGLFVGLQNSLLRYNAGSNSFRLIDRSKTINFLFKNTKQQVMVSTYDGLYVLTGSKLVQARQVFPELASIGNCSINSCVPMGDSVSILGSENEHGIFIWNYKRKTVTAINNSSRPVTLRSNIVNKVFKDSEGKIWVLSDYGIDVLNQNFTKIKYLKIINPVNGDAIKLSFDICELENKLWLTCYSYGLVQLTLSGKPLKVLNTQNGLCNDGVYKIFNAPKNNLFITSNNGLSVLNTNNNTFTNYYEQDGLHANAFEENCGVAEGGKIYAGGLNGFTIIDPALLFTNKVKPRLYFNTIKIDTKDTSLNIKNIGIKDLTVPNDVLQTTISFSGLNYSNPGRVTFKYRFEEENSKWISLGTQNFVNIIGLRPGTYTFLVNAANEDGVWAAKPIKLTMLFLPKWYQTWWFKFVVLCAMALIFYSIYLYRVKQEKIQQQIRRNIANDLHDDLGSSLTSIKMFTHLAIAEKQNSSYLAEIEMLITQTAAGLRDMLWVLEDSRDNLTELMERIKKFAVPLANASQVTVECYVDEAISTQTISKTEKRNLLLMAKEALNNSFKYAQCKKVQILFTVGNNNKLRVTIADDGIGFDTAAQTGGYGVNNLKYRAEQINYKCQISSSPHKGTVLTIENV